ncbi:hypothetical protein GF314_06570 [bacterium]|nr:hypothetical protein [bacterium]
MSRHLDVLLLLALPASGKSEARTFIASLDPAECERDLGIGETVQLDDFPYVHLMRRVSDELTARGHEGAFFLSPALPFRDPRDWGTLIELLNEDYHDVVAREHHAPENAAQWLFSRLDRARDLVGAPLIFQGMDLELRAELARALEDECRDLLEKKNAAIPGSLDGKTVVIEFARGGADGSPLPLPAPYGYRHSLSRLAPEILDRAAILYIWVTPEDSRRKNDERTDPDDPGSILNHGVPNAVMYGDYGCDDMAWLLETSDRPHTVRVERDGRTWHLPVARFDNREDLTTFVRDDRGQWSPADTDRLRQGLAGAFAELHAAREATDPADR